MASASPWLPYRVVRGEPRVRLVCLPYAGGTALSYRGWSAALPPRVEVCPVELPGHGARIAEPCIADLDRLIVSLIDGLAPILDRPVALFGHSMGGLVAFELARSLSPAPVHVFVSGASAPHIEPRQTMPESDDELVDLLRKLGGTPAEVLAHEELLELTLPVLRADLRLAWRRLERAHDPIPSPITAFTGRADPEVTEPDVAAWRDYTRGAFKLVPVAGDHFFFASPGGRPVVLDEIATTLASI